MVRSWQRKLDTLRVGGGGWALERERGERGERGGFHFISPRSINLRRNAFRHPSCPRTDADGQTRVKQAATAGTTRTTTAARMRCRRRHLQWHARALSPGHRRRPTCALQPPVNCLSRTQFVLMRRTKEEGGTEGGKQVAAAAAAQNPNGGDLLSHLKSTLRAPLNTAAIVAKERGAMRNP